MEAIHLGDQKVEKTLSTVSIAVIDDGFRLSHHDLKDCFSVNENEIPKNGIDDDGNGYIDDYQGWDVSDNDADVTIPGDLLNSYYHGTYIASLIIKVVNEHFGDRSKKKISILPIKVLSDDAINTQIRDGYKGIRYAIDRDVDIICLAWNGGQATSEELQLLAEARSKGICIVAAAGNFKQKELQFPAKSPHTIAVGAVTPQLVKWHNSGYGDEVDLMAPGEMVFGAHPRSDTSHAFNDGTSPATALVTGAAAVLKSYGATEAQIKSALLNSCDVLEEPKYAGKLGAGLVNLNEAVKYLLCLDKSLFHNSSRVKGSILIDKRSSGRNFSIQPKGAFEGTELVIDKSKLSKKTKGDLTIKISDTIWWSKPVYEVPGLIEIPSGHFTINLCELKFGKNDVLTLHHHGKTVDSTRLFCKDKIELTQESGSITDGSGSFNYANECDCYWQILAPPNHRVEFVFEFLDTEPNVDYVRMFDGRSTIPHLTIGNFSGSSLPPTFYSRSNEVLIWFVTNSNNTGEGWEINYRFIDVGH